MMPQAGNEKKKTSHVFNELKRTQCIEKANKKQPASPNNYNLIDADAKVEGRKC